MHVVVHLIVVTGALNFLIIMLINNKDSWRKENWSFWELVLAKSAEDFMDRKKVPTATDTATVENFNIIGE